MKPTFTAQDAERIENWKLKIENWDFLEQRGQSQACLSYAESRQNCYVVKLHDAIINNHIVVSLHLLYK